MQRNWPPSGVLSTFHLRNKYLTSATISKYLELVLSLWDRLWLLVEIAGGLNDEANWTGVRQSRLEGIPSFGIFKFLVFPVYSPSLCSIHKGRNGICITKYSCKERNDLFCCHPETYECKAWKGQSRPPKTSQDILPYV